jgi:hypothetical protein
LGQEILVDAPRPLAEALAALAAAGEGCQILMVDGQLVLPAAAPPSAWGEIRLRSAAGMVTLRRRGDGIAVLVFGNASAALLALRDRIAAALGAPAP